MFIVIALLDQPFKDGLTSKAATVHFVTWPIAGLVYGITLWFVNEHKYKKH